MIVVDDLDPGFSIETDEADAGGFRLQGGLAGFFAPSNQTDQGLLVYQSFGGPPTEWSRYEQPTSWGRYRRTTALAPAGEGTTARSTGRSCRRTAAGESNSTCRRSRRCQPAPRACAVKCGSATEVETHHKEEGTTTAAYGSR